MDLADIRVRSARDEPHLAAALADVLLDCVEGGASVGFMQPLARDKALAFWAGVIEGERRGERVLLVAEDAAGRVVGTVQVALGLPENQPHRGDITKLLVHRAARGRGVGAALMQAAERAARQAGRTLLVLDTASGPAERLYARLDWQRVGVVPDYALWPGGGLCATTFFFKTLR